MLNFTFSFLGNIDVKNGKNDCFLDILYITLN